MADVWNRRHADGTTIFFKLASHLSSYQKQFQDNQNCFKTTEVRISRMIYNDGHVIQLQLWYSIYVAQTI
jgi:hypothetical protein